MLILWLQRGQGSNLNSSSPFQNERVAWSLGQAHSWAGHCIQPLLPPVPLCSPVAAAALPALALSNVCVLLTGHPIPLNLHESSRSGLQRLASISNPPPLISSTKHPSVLERSVGSISQVGYRVWDVEIPCRDQQFLLTSPLAPQGMPIQLHTPYSPEHAKVPVGSITMGLPLTMDPKKLGKDWETSCFSPALRAGGIELARSTGERRSTGHSKGAQRELLRG